MKIIDAHVHGIIPEIKEPTAEQTWWIGGEPVDRSNELVREMDSYGVEKAVMLYTHCPNELTCAAARKYPGRFVWFCSWAPEELSTGKQAADLVEKWLGEPDCKGVGELNFSRFYVRGKTETLPEVLNEWRVVMDVISAKKAMILFHTGYTSGHSGRNAFLLRWIDPILIDELARDYPDTPIIIGHSGGIFPPHYENALMVAFNHENVYLDTSKAITPVIERAVNEIGASRILFGTDWVKLGPLPYGPKSELDSHLYSRNIRVIEEARISDSDREKIFYQNAGSLIQFP